MGIYSFKRYLAVVCIALCIGLLGGIAILSAAPDNAQAIKTYKTKGTALYEYDVNKFRVLKNTNYGKVSITRFDNNPVHNTNIHSYRLKKGNTRAALETIVYLPVSYNRSGDMGNPQSINVTPDGHYAYIVYPYSKKSTTCRIVRSDLFALAELDVLSGGLDQLVWASQYHMQDCLDDDYLKQVLACVKFGPWIKNFGHGAAVSYNPKDKHLWFTSATGKWKTNLQRVNMTTLKPDLKYTFKFKKTVKMGNNLAFDNKGRFYFHSYSGGGWSPKGTIKIYQGKITKKNKVRVKLIMQGIRNPLSKNIQSMGYNPHNNRLYMVSNGAIMSIPVNKLGKLKNRDVRSTIFTGKREYEGIAFDARGNGYVLMNKMPEILKTSPGF